MKDISQDFQGHLISVAIEGRDRTILSVNRIVWDRAVFFLPQVGRKANMKSVLVTLLLFLLNTAKVRPNPAVALLGMAWNKINPGSLQNRVKRISKDLSDIKTSMVKAEFAVIFGQDIRTLEFLNNKYLSFQDDNEIQKRDWADTALGYGQDGFERATTSLRDMIEGRNQLFAQGSILEVIARKSTKVEECDQMDFAYDYLVGLWTMSHAVWSQAYRIKNRNETVDLKQKAEERIAVFHEIRESAAEILPSHCLCLEEGVFYADVAYFFKDPKTANVTSAKKCQRGCQADKECKAWTFFESNSSRCFLHQSNEHKLYGRSQKDALILYITYFQLARAFRVLPSQGHNSASPVIGF